MAGIKKEKSKEQKKRNKEIKNLIADNKTNEATEKIQEWARNWQQAYPKSCSDPDSLSCSPEGIAYDASEIEKN